MKYDLFIDASRKPRAYRYGVLDEIMGLCFSKTKFYEFDVAGNIYRVPVHEYNDHKQQFEDYFRKVELK